MTQGQFQKGKYFRKYEGEMLDTICKENRLLYNIVKKQELYDFALG